MNVEDEWWYYTVELTPGKWVKGIYPDDMVLLPRLNLSKIALSGHSALDVATMEGLMPILMAKAGASDVVAVDFERPGAPTEGSDSIPTNRRKLEFLQSAHGVDFNFGVVPEGSTAFDYLMTSSRTQFDLVNLSGLLYHVFSPMHWLGSIRGLVKHRGLAIISTNVVRTPQMIMEFNDRGRLQPNLTTYWYMSVPLMDYMLRYFRLRPIRAEYSEYPDSEFGYLSVVCRAEENVVAADGDSWIEDSAWHSWDSKWFGGHNPSGYSQSFIMFRDGNDIRPEDRDLGLLSRDVLNREWLDLWKFVSQGPRQPFLGNDRFTARLALADTN